MAGLAAHMAHLSLGAKKYMIWVDTNPRDQGLLSFSTDSGNELVLLTSTSQALAWLDEHESDVMARRVILVTNQSRPEARFAGTELIEAIRRKGMAKPQGIANAWLGLPAMIFCGEGNYKIIRTSRLDILCSITNEGFCSFASWFVPSCLAPPRAVNYYRLPVEGLDGMDKIRVVITSDTHGINVDNIPEADYLIHAGDFATRGRQHEVQEFAEWVSRMQFRVRFGILCVSGNHEEIPAMLPASVGQQCVLLDDKEIKLTGGMTLYGARWPGYTQEEHESYRRIPDGVNILVTHHPPTGYFDRFFTGDSVGSDILREEVDEKRPFIHIFGHNHDCYGVMRNRSTVFVCASACTDDAVNEVERTRRPIIVIDIPVCYDGIAPDLTPIFTESVQIDPSEGA